MGSFLRSLRHNYILVEALQAASVMGTGDLIAQKFVEKKEQVDFKRLATFNGAGLFFLGPITSVWYRFLDGRISRCRPRWQRGLLKMLPDQIIMAPIMLACVLSMMELCMGDRSVEGVKNELQKKYTTILANNYKVWPAVQTFNLTLVPVRNQVLVAQLFGVGWNTYFSYAKNNEITEEPEDAKETGENYTRSNPKSDNEKK